MPRRLLALLAIGAIGTVNAAQLELENKISLGLVRGRIDHLALDDRRQRLFIAELGNDSVGVVDLKEGRWVRTLPGLHEPQGIGYVPSSDTVYVADAKDGSVHLFEGSDLTPAGQIALGSDADNIRVDDQANHVFVGYGSGAIAIIDTATRRKIADIPLKAHPESFQLSRSGPQIWVNVPEARELALLDRASRKQLASWSASGLSDNFPLAVDEAHHRILVVYRHPARMGVFDTTDGRLMTTVSTCSDADDLFVDAKRDLAYVICGEGFVDVVALRDEAYSSLGRIPTSPGARTGLFMPQLDRLVVAVRANATTPASIWLFRPGT